MSKKKQSDTEVVVANAMREVKMAMNEVAQATAPLKRMSQKNLRDLETDSQPYNEPGQEPLRDAAIQIKKPGLLGNAGTVITIQSAQNIQIGNNNTMIVNSSSRRQVRRYSPPPQPKLSSVDKEDVKKVLNSTRFLDERDLTIASSKFMGQQWRRTLRLIGLEDIEIESKYVDFYSQGVKEITFQALKYWTQKNPDTATVGHLTTALSEIFSPDEVCDKFKP